MRAFLLLMALVVASVSAELFEQCDSLFAKFTLYHKLKYSHSVAAERNAIFCENMKKADALNEIQKGAGFPSAFGVTKFADRSEKEFGALLGRKNKGAGVNPKTPVKQPKGVSAATLVDWTAAGMVTPVKNQGQCGSCWAHSAAEAIESQWALNGNSIWEFSPQQIASCTTACQGCGGGDTVYAYEYLMSLPTTEGLGSGAFAPYIQSMYTECTAMSCTEACSSIDLSALQTYEQLTGYYAQVTGYSYATPGCTGSCSSQNMTLLAQNLATNGPPSVCVDASSWNLYTGNGAVVSAATCKSAYYDLDHCVQLTGFQASPASGSPYWMVRNSW